MRATAALALVAATLAPGASAGATTIDVKPGQDAIARAVSRASGGDTLRIHHGRYPEALEVTKRVQLTAAPGERPPTIDGRCRTQFTVDVRRAGVSLSGLKVIGATEGFGQFPAEVNFANIATGTARHLLLRDTCDAEYGINVFGSGQVELAANRARGFSDAGLYIGAITDTGNGALTVRDNESFANNRGIIVEDSFGGTIRVRNNDLHDNRASGEGEPSGIFVHNSDGVLFSHNRIGDNGSFGVHLDPNSDDNVLFDNVVRDNPTNLLDEGSGNCGSGNRFGDSGNLLPPC